MLSREGLTWNRMVTGLIESGFTFGEASIWAAEWHLPEFPELLAIDASEFRDAGFTVTEALGWYLVGAGPATAVLYANQGWRPQQAHALWDALTDRHSSPWRLRPVQAERDWLATGLAAERAARYAAAGVTPREAIALDARQRAGDPTIEPGLRLLAALRTGST